MAAEKVPETPTRLDQDPNLNAIRAASSEEGARYAFLVHSADSLKNGGDPDIDNKPLARQKRRRTSPEDQAILEAAFLQNPKPDKWTRMDIVSKVALGEKEVQIWFQNRRQSTRRKQRPLEPHEISSLAFSASYSSPYGASTSTDPRPQQQEDQSGAEASRSEQDTMAQSLASTAQTAHMTAEKENEEPDEVVPISSQHGEKATTISVPPFTEVPSSQPPLSSQESNSERWLSNRRSRGPFRSFHESMSQSAEPACSPASQELPKESTRQGLKKTTSSVRLSFGADGSATVLNGDSPSPPRKLLPPPSVTGTPVPAPKLHRSQSSASLNEPGSQESNRSHSLRRVSSFRSHDSRTWEFFCDRDARSELEERAEQEHSGSAADAIKLARSNSGRSSARSAPVPVTAKRSIAPYAEVSSTKRVKTATPASTQLAAATPFKTPLQPLMQRSASASNSYTSAPGQTPGGKPTSKTPKLKQTPTFEFPATDSDKENWSPERHLHFIQSMTTSPAIPPTTARRRGPVAHTPLKQVSPIKGLDSSARTRREVEDYDHDDEDEDEEVARFMGEGGGARREEGRKRQSRQSDSVSEEEDLDCVQGLLSLSQGAWK